MDPAKWISLAAFGREYKSAVVKASDAVRTSSRSVVTEIAKVDQDLHVIYGVVLDPYIIDAHDDWIPPNEVEKTAHDWMANSRTMKLQHGNQLAAVPVESWIVPYPTPADYKAAIALEPHRIWRLEFGSDFIHSGAWVLGTRVLDQEAWSLVLSGELTSYSIGGFGMRTEIERVPMPDVTVLTIEAPR